ncbi:Topoisomerase 1-associated factor 1 [Agyrium rufum]|nr:Topoisomerase 1-associated factor 1 [Agyrium rufum]
MDDTPFGMANGASVVDPEVRAHVSSLVTAVGGTGFENDGHYLLGDDALACLRDLKRWLKLYDEKTNRFDVARCLAEANLVKGDLLEILAAWSENTTEDRLKSKIALACLELLVPLTWPYEKKDHDMTVNHHRHLPYLQLAQVGYKGAILEHRSEKILHNIIRIGLPSIALAAAERTSRDEGIIKILLYFLRNITSITPPSNLAHHNEYNEVSRSAIIEAFQKQDVFALILTLASNIEEFSAQDVVIMELLFHLLKGVNPAKIFMDNEEKTKRSRDDLERLMQKEVHMRRDHAKIAPTRHNRFGTMIWVKRDDQRLSAVSGQDTLSSGQRAMLRMDQTKKWKRPGQNRKTEEESETWDLPVSLSTSASHSLQTMVEEFLDSGFNPLFNNIRRAIEREADRVLQTHSQQYFYLIAWFLEAERARRTMRKQRDDQEGGKVAGVIEPESFGLIATVMNQENFVTMNRFMQDRLEMKSYSDLYSGMRCFTQILLTIQDMADSPLEEDQEIADNIQNRIFYEETTHDRIVAIVRGYKDQGFRYLDACTELSHVFLRVLERYSKENLDLQIRSKRRARKKKAKQAAPLTDETNPYGDDSEAEEVAEAQRVSKERKFDFTRFSARFLSQACVDTHIKFTAFYRDLTTEQLKRAHRFFHRVAFKLEMTVLLFRLDIIMLFQRMIKGPEGLETSNSIFKEWEELSRQIFRRLTKKLQQRPALAIELLFSKINATTYYLEYGQEKQTVEKRSRPPAELEIKAGLDRDRQIGVAIAVLVDMDKSELARWVAEELSKAKDERRGWETEAQARRLEGSDETESPTDKAPSILIKASSETVRMAMFKEAHLRLLMNLVGFERLGDEDVLGATWIVPSALSSSILEELLGELDKHLTQPGTHVDIDGQPIAALDMIRRKPKNARESMMESRSRRVEFDDESNGFLDDGEEEFLFPAGGPTARKLDANVALQTLKRKRKHKRRPETDDELDDDTGVDDATREARRRARLENERAKRLKIKSEEIIRDSDDETDEERDRLFYSKEAAIAKKNAAKIKEALIAGRISRDLKEGSEAVSKSKTNSTTRKSLFGGDEDDQDDEDEDGGSEVDIVPKAKDGDTDAISVLSSRIEMEDSDDAFNVRSKKQTPVTSPFEQFLENKENEMRLDEDDDELAYGIGTWNGRDRARRRPVVSLSDDDE